VDEVLEKHALNVRPLSKDYKKMEHFFIFLTPPLDRMSSSIEEKFTNHFGVRFEYSAKKTFIRAIVQKRNKTVARQLDLKLLVLINWEGS
jgi:membrane-bound lytic murein transglycosylase MltF